MKKEFSIAIVIAAAVACAAIITYLFLDNERSVLDETSRPKLPGHFIKLPDGTVHYETKGLESAQPVVLVHGFSVPYYIWDRNIDALAAAGFRAIRYDLYGRGYSDRPGKSYDLDLLVSQLYSLLESLHIDKQVDLVGLSYGAPVIAAFFVKYPEKVRKLCFIDPYVSRVSPGRIFPLNIPLVGEYLMAVLMVPLILPKSQPDDLYEPGRFPYWEAMYREQTKYKGFGRAILSTIRHMSEIDALSLYSVIGGKKSPVLIIRGEEDKTVSYPEIEAARNAMPQTEFHSIARAGHVSNYERP
jgi:pimeloyl-ACP methyl ester carboxylesterase